MTVSFDPGMNPDAYARVYASENNMSFEDAKAELKAKHGDPQAPTGETIFQDFVNGLSNISEGDFDLSAFDVDDDKNKSNPLADLIAFFLGKAKETTETTEESDDKTTSTDSTTKTDSTSKTSSSKKSSSKKDKVDDRQVEIDDTILEYMQHHNCTAEEAKEALYGKFGDPTANSSSGSSSSSSSKEPSAKRKAADDTVQEYMKHHNCSQEEAMKALQGMWGNPPER